MSKRKSFLLIITLLIFTTSCSKMFVKPDADSIKTVAFVSIYSNSDPKDINSKGKDLSAMKKMANMVVKGALKTNDNIYNSSMMQLTLYGANKFKNTIEENSSWKFMPFNEVVASKAYKNFTISGSKLEKKVMKNKFLSKMITADYTVPDSVKLIPLEKIKSNSKKYINGVEIHEAFRKKVGKLASELNVDAVCIIRNFIGYNSDVMTLLPLGKKNAEPVYGFSFAFVDKNGKMISNGIWNSAKYQGDKIGMLGRMNFHVYLDDGKVFKEFQNTCDKLMKKVGKKVAKELTKK